MATPDKKQKFNALYIINTMKEFTDEKHPLSASEITDKACNKYGDGIVAKDTVERFLGEIHTYYFDHPDWSVDGYKIESLVPVIRKKTGEQILIPYKEYVQDEGCEIRQYEMVKKKRKKRSSKKMGSIDLEKEDDFDYKKAKFYYKSVFEPEELKVLIDAIDAYSFMATKDVTDIITKLMRIQNMAFNVEEFKNFEKLHNKKLRMSDSWTLPYIRDLDEVISKGQWIELDYGFYGINSENKCELIQKEGYPKIVKPLQMVWGNGYYYLVASTEQGKQINYRIDRILDCYPVESEVDTNLCVENRSKKKMEYRNHHPVMYVGETYDVHMLVAESKRFPMINHVIDTFGLDVRIQKASEKALFDAQLPKNTQQYQEEGVVWYHVHLKEVTLGGTLLWAAEYCEHCKIISPQEAVDAMKEKFKTGLGMYEK